MGFLAKESPDQPCIDETNQDLMLDVQNWSEFGETVGIVSGEGFRFANSIEDNPDYIVTDQSAVNQRDLW